MSRGLRAWVLGHESRGLASRDVAPCNNSLRAPRVVKESGGAGVVLQEPAESLAAADLGQRDGRGAVVRRRQSAQRLGAKARVLILRGMGSRRCPARSRGCQLAGRDFFPANFPTIRLTAAREFRVPIGGRLRRERLEICEGAFVATLTN